MNILLISPYPSIKTNTEKIAPGGIGSWTLRYLSSKITQNNKVVTINTVMQGKRLSDHTQLNICDELLRTKRILLDLNKALKSEHFDVAHFNTNCGKLGIIRDFLCAYLINQYKIPLIIHCRCNVEDQLSGNKISMYFFNKVILKSREVIVLNNTSKNYVEKLTNKSCILFPNFISDNYIRNQTKTITPQIRKVLFVGHLNKQKGASELLSAAKLLPAIQFIIAGSITSDMNKISFPPNINNVGIVDPECLKDILDDADIFLFPTYSEGFSNALLEAMARGLPIIATDVGANKDMIEEKGGIIIPTKDITSIVEAVKKLEDPQMRLNMSIWNIQKVKKYYTIDIVINHLEDVYKHVQSIK